jgi:DNA-binding MarR family transcriptional regulator
MSGDAGGAGPGQRASGQPAPAASAPAQPAAGPPGSGQGGGAQAIGGHAGKSHGSARAGGWDVPWAESPTTGSGRPGRAELELEFATAMRRTGSLMQLMGQAAADRIGINATDLNCLNILSFSGHMTAGELARATGLTTASITGVVDRLEQAGYVRRERDPHDRRRVVVTLVLEQAMQNVASVFLPVMRDWREMSAAYSDDELRLIVDFYARMEQVFRAHLLRLRDR